jgi:hypothetical protein
MNSHLSHLRFHTRFVLSFTTLIAVLVACVNTSPQNPNTSRIAYKPSPISPPKIPAFVTSVTNFAAVPNDGKDDTSAIQAGLDAVNAAGGGTLEFPAGRYDISIDPAKNRALTLYPRLRLAGKAGETAIIRLADNQIIYESIMATATYPTRLDDAEFLNLTFDGNGLNNPIRKPEETNGDLGNATLRYVIRSFAGERVRIRQCTFINLENGNTVSFNGDAIADIVIEESKFLSVGGALVDHDHSTIYTYGQRVLIANNEFQGRNGAGTIGARTAIETHFDDLEVRNNKVTGYMQGANLVGRASVPSRQLYTNNTIKSVAVGLKIWSLGFPDPNDSRPAFTDLQIRNNEIRVDADAWWASKGMVTDAPAGIAFETPVSNGSVSRLEILENQIVFDSFQGRKASDDRISVGIGLRSVEDKPKLPQVKILGNTIRNTIGPCILSTVSLGNNEASQITGNTLTDCGRGPNLIGDGDVLRSGIAITGTTRNLTLSKNTITTGTVPASTLNGIVLGSNCLGGCVVISNQTSDLKQGVLSIGSGWMINSP